MSKYKVIISGGGTGGHIFPAIAIANALKTRYKDMEILFVGALGKMEMEKVPAAGYEIIGLPIMGLQRRLTAKNLKFPFMLLKSLMKAKKILRDFQPDVVIGVGGYASGAIMRAATRKNIPTLIQEQNSFPGMTNRLLAKKVSKICVAFEGMEKYFPKEKIVITGNPVRQDIRNLDGKKDRGLEHFGLKSGKTTLLAIGGSLGARTINLGIETLLKHLKEHDIQLIWQTGKHYAKTAQESVKALEYDGVKSSDFIRSMDLAYATADLIISRAGAISVSEIALAGKAAILIPSPNVAEDHQTKNALALVNRNCALMIKDSETEAKLLPTVTELMDHPERIEQLKQQIQTHFQNNDAASAIADTVINLIPSRHAN